MSSGFVPAPELDLVGRPVLEPWGCRWRVQVDHWAISIVQFRPEFLYGPPDTPFELAVFSENDPPGSDTLRLTLLEVLDFIGKFDPKTWQGIEHYWDTMEHVV